MPAKSKNIVFIHGMFKNPESWKEWIKYFEQKGYSCHAPAYPFHAGEPDKLRDKINAGLGRLTLCQVVAGLSDFIDRLDEKPVLIGHSMGGLIVQKLIEKNLGLAGVCIDSAPPRGIISFKWSFWRANFSTINPLKGNSVCLPSLEWFHYAFCNTMTLAQTKIEFDKFVVPESRNIPRSSIGKDGAVDFDRPHQPLLFIAGEKDHIIPSSLTLKNFNAYRDRNSRKDFKEFSDRTHYICGQKGWEEVADFVIGWISRI